MHFKSLAVAAIAACISGLAGAAQSSFAEFKLDVPPALASGPTTAGPDAVGHRLYPNAFHGTVQAEWQVGGKMRYDWSPWFDHNSPGAAAGSLEGAPFGEGSFTWTGSEATEHGITGGLLLHDGTMRASVSRGEADFPVVHGYVHAGWRRAFKLNPHASVALSGLSSFNNSGSGLSSIDYDFHSWGVSSSASLVSHNTGNASVSISGDLYDEDLAASAFSYSTGLDGRLSLTLTNHSDVAIGGQFELGLGAGVITAVPEPATWLMVCLGGLGIAARRFGKRQAATCDPGGDEGRLGGCYRLCRLAACPTTRCVSCIDVHEDVSWDAS